MRENRKSHVLARAINQCQISQELAGTVQSHEVSRRVFILLDYLEQYSVVFSKFLGERPSGVDQYSGTFRTESIWYLSWYFAFRKIILSNSCESLDR